MLAVAATALLTVVVQPADAASTLKFTGFEYGSVDVKIAAVPAAPITHASIGAYNTQISNNGGTTYGATFESFCIDVWQSLSFNTTYSLGSTPTAPSPYQTGKDYTKLPTLIGYTPKSGSPGVDLINTQVLQNLSRLYDEAHSGGHLVNTAPFTTSNLNSGDFYSVGNTTVNSQEVVAQAQEWLNYLMAYSGTKYTVNGYASPNKQDVIVFTPVPEPETYALMLAGLGLLGFAERRRKRKLALA